MNTTARNLAYTTIFGFFITLWLMFFKEMPEKSGDTLKIMIAILAQGVGVLWGFYWGSSYSSQKKDVKKGEDGR